MNTIFSVNALSEDVAWARDQFRSHFPGTDALPNENVLTAFAKVIGAQRNMLSHQIAFMGRQFFVHLCDDETLDIHGRDLGLPRLAASAAAGEFLFRGDADTLLPTGTILQHATGQQFALDHDLTLDSSGEGRAIATALVTGPQGNLDALDSMTLPSPIGGLREAWTGEFGTAGGALEEDEDRYRTRLLYHLANPPATGSRSDYVRWTLDALASVSHVSVSVGEYNRIFVSFLVYDTADGIPTAAQVATVQTALDVQRPLLAVPIARAPSAVTLNPVIHGYAGSDRQDVVAALGDMMFRKATIGTGATDGTSTFHNSWMREAVSAANGELWHGDIQPGDVLLADNQVARLGTVSFLP